MKSVHSRRRPLCESQVSPHMHSHIKEAPVPAYTHTPRVKFEQLSNRITNTPDVTGSPLHTCTHKHTHTVTRRLASELRLAHAHVYPALVKSLNSPRSFLKERSSRVALIQSNPSRERTKARGRREEGTMEEDGGVENEAAKLAKREENKRCSVACEPDLTCTVVFVGGAKSAHFTVHF